MPWTPPTPKSLRCQRLLSCTRNSEQPVTGSYPEPYETRPYLPILLVFPPKPYIYPPFDHSNYIWQRVQVMELLIMWLSPAYYLSPLGSKQTPSVASSINKTTQLCWMLERGLQQVVLGLHNSSLKTWK
jgi:hypothetical protein